MNATKQDPKTKQYNQNPDGVELRLSPARAEEFFFNALVNGLSVICGDYDLECLCNNAAFDRAKTSLANDLKSGGRTEEACFEDVLMQILREGGRLTLFDLAKGQRYRITIDDVRERMNYVRIDWIAQMVRGTDDIETADAILQTVFFRELLYS